MERKRKSEALPSAPPGIRSIRPTSEAAEPRGAREALCHGRLPAAPEGKKSLCCGYSEDRCRRKVAFDNTACAGSEVALGKSRLRGSQASLNSDCQKTGESNLSLSTMPHVACSVVVNAFQQYERLGSLATAKLERKRLTFGLAHPPPREKARIHWGKLMGAC